MKVVVGLGNPGPRYRNSRHNLGFAVLDHVAERLGVRFDREKHQGLYAEALCAGDRVRLVKPMTYMNCSGDCVAPFVRNAIPSLASILVVADDVNLPLGRLRLRAEGGAGGHNGLKSLIERLGGQDFPRLRMGVGDNRSGPDLADHVLGKFQPEEWPIVTRMVAEAAEAVLCWVESGIDPAMNVYNKQV